MNEKINERQRDTFSSGEKEKLSLSDLQQEQHGHASVLGAMFLKSMPLLRRELNAFVEEHNCHRKQRGRLTPQGIPEDLYSFPESKRTFVFYLCYTS